jgi:Domain of unknown function (DUF6839)
MPEELPVSTVEFLPEYLTLISESQYVAAISESLGKLVTHRFDAFFVHAVDGEYIEVWGMFGIIPWATREVYRVL